MKAYVVPSSKGSRGGQRPYRVGEQIRQVLSELLMSGALKDPRLAAADIVSITEVRLTADLRLARVFTSIFPSDDDVIEQVMAGLQDSIPRIKGHVAKELRLRHTPDLRFTHDRSIERGARIEALIREARDEDAALRAPDIGVEGGEEES